MPTPTEPLWETIASGAKAMAFLHGREALRLARHARLATRVGLVASAVSAVAAGALAVLAEEWLAESVAVLTLALAAGTFAVSVRQLREIRETVLRAEAVIARNETLN